MSTTAKSNDIVGQLIDNRFFVKKFLGGGAFGKVYECEDLANCKVVALKFEFDNPDPQLPNEYECYKTLESCPNVPNAYEMFRVGKSNVLVMDKMGPSLDKLFKYCNRKFSLKTTLSLLDQMIRTLEYIHNSGILHRDVKPQNFLMGSNDLYRRLFIIDFGISMRFIDTKTKEQIMFTSNNGLVGTAVYASVNALLGEQQSPRDDLESVMYSAIRFLKSDLPWQHIKENGINSQHEKITQLKMQTSSDVLCEGLPPQFKTVYDYIRKLTFNERPNYAWIRKTFNKLFISQGFVDDGIYDWDNAAPIFKPLPALYLQRDAFIFVRGNERRICQRKQRVHVPKPRKIFIAGWRTH